LRIAVILDFALVAWFFLLAMAEFYAARGRAVAEPGGDARLVTNFGLGVVVLAFNGLLPMAKVGSAVAGQGLGAGLAVHYAWPWAVALAVLVLADSFAAYWTHRAMHAVPALWRIHRVHHTDCAVDVSTSIRNHPLELAVALPVSAAVILAVGAPVSAVVAAQTIMVTAVIWQHADIDVPRLERALAPLLITPAIHRLHHSPERPLHDSNYGELIMLWDRLFGTLRRSGGRGRVGLEGQVARSDHLLEQIWSPVYAPRLRQFTAKPDSQGLSFGARPAGDENRVVAADRPGDLGQIRIVERHPDEMRGPGRSLDHHQVGGGFD
jgi:sterol desaturase/sphingolipid hydroxylase (fatty acid hydroxylase superfamily)